MPFSAHEGCRGGMEGGRVLSDGWDLFVMVLNSCCIIHSCTLAYRIAGNIGGNFIWRFGEKRSKINVGVFYLAVAESM